MNLAYPLILGSKSPRRKEILSKAGYDFTSTSLDTAEDYSPQLDKRTVAAYLAELKALAFKDKDQFKDKIILTADTTVLLNDQLLEKPQDANDAERMLSLLSGQKHEVISAFSILWKGNIQTYTDTTEVYFADISTEEIKKYVREHKPFDKAGAYGIQEGIGLTHIYKLEGSYFTVMGLPIHKVYDVLKQFVK